jgi:hypothetical protein
MRKLFTALAATATILMAGSIPWKAEAATVTGVGSLPALTKTYSPIERVYYPYGYGYRPYGYGYGYRPYGYYGYGYRPYGYYGYGYRPYGYYGYGYRPYGYGYGWSY